eukprot:9135917-Pyramimonas_sp.AAC.1
MDCASHHAGPVLPGREPTQQQALENTRHWAVRLREGVDLQIPHPALANAIFHCKEAVPPKLGPRGVRSKLIFGHVRPPLALR